MMIRSLCEHGDHSFIHSCVVVSLIWFASTAGDCESDSGGSVAFNSENKDIAVNGPKGDRGPILDSISITINFTLHSLFLEHRSVAGVFDRKLDRYLTSDRGNLPLQ